MPDDLKDFILWIFEASLDAQLRAVRRLRSGRPEPATARRLPGLSQVDMAYDILKRARTPFPISELLASSIHFTFHLTVDRESLVSSLSKKIVRPIASSALTEKNDQAGISWASRHVIPP